MCPKCVRKLTDTCPIRGVGEPPNFPTIGEKSEAFKESFFCFRKIYYI